MILIGASSIKILTNSKLGSWEKGGCAPNLSGLINGPSKCVPSIFVLLQFKLRCLFKPFKANFVSSKLALTVVGYNVVVPLNRW